MELLIYFCYVIVFISEPIITFDLAVWLIKNRKSRRAESESDVKIKTAPLWALLVFSILNEAEKLLLLIYDKGIYAAIAKKVTERFTGEYEQTASSLAAMSALPALITFLLALLFAKSKKSRKLGCGGGVKALCITLGVIFILCCVMSFLGAKILAILKNQGFPPSGTF